jgi:hypothetical protein
VSVLRACHPLAGTAVLCAAALVALSVLVSNGVEFAIVPAPETEAESLVRALKARRFTAVKGELTESLKEAVQDDQLESLFESVKSAHNGISDAHGESAQKASDRARATVKVKLEDKTEETIELPLEKEHGLWRVSSLEPLGRLTR